MKKRNVLIFLNVLVLVLSFSFASAGFSNFFKQTGQVTSEGYWTGWYNIDNPSGSGDYETLNTLVGPFGYEICAGSNEFIVDVECRVVGSKIDYSETGQKVVCTTSKGAYCKNDENLFSSLSYHEKYSCADYEVRFLCGDNTTVSFVGNETGEVSSCIESDDGFDIFQKGKVSIFGNENLFNEDVCLEKTTLREFSCDETLDYIPFAAEDVECPEGYSCSDGACVKQEVGGEIICSDTDGGKDIYEKGITISGDESSLKDVCVGSSLLKEFYCAEDGIGNFDYLSCPEGYSCSDGACVKQEVGGETICSDTDGGINYLVKGTTVAPEEVGSPYDDVCTDLGYLREWYCYEDYYSPGAVGKIDYRTVNCSEDIGSEYICQDGACVKQEVGGETICSDTDGGINYLVKGTTVAPGERDSPSTDVCTDLGYLREWYCYEDYYSPGAVGKITYETVNCSEDIGSEYICQDGACVLNGVSPSSGYFVSHSSGALIYPEICSDDFSDARNRSAYISVYDEEKNLVGQCVGYQPLSYSGNCFYLDYFLDDNFYFGDEFNNIPKLSKESCQGLLEEISNLIVSKDYSHSLEDQSDIYLYSYEDYKHDSLKTTPDPYPFWFESIELEFEGGAVVQDELDTICDSYYSVARSNGNWDYPLCGDDEIENWEINSISPTGIGIFNEKGNFVGHCFGQTRTFEGDLGKICVDSVYYIDQSLLPENILDNLDSFAAPVLDVPKFSEDDCQVIWEDLLKSFKDGERLKTIPSNFYSYEMRGGQFIQESNSVFCFNEVDNLKFDMNKGAEKFNFSSQEEEQKSQSDDCIGCELEGDCLPLGYVIEGKYCSENLFRFAMQKEFDEPCEQNFECGSGICISNKCVSNTAWNRFLKWIAG